MLAGVIPSQIPGRGCVPDSPEANAYEEERRLYYVGMTRAKEQLYVFTFGPNLTSAFSGEVFEKTKPLNAVRKTGTAVGIRGSLLKTPDKKVQKLPPREVEACIANTEPAGLRPYRLTALPRFCLQAKTVPEKYPFPLRFPGRYLP